MIKHAVSRGIILYRLFFINQEATDALISEYAVNAVSRGLHAIYDTIAISSIHGIRSRMLSFQLSSAAHDGVNDGALKLPDFERLILLAVRNR